MWRIHSRLKNRCRLGLGVHTALCGTGSSLASCRDSGTKNRVQITRNSFEIIVLFLLSSAACKASSAAEKTAFFWYRFCPFPTLFNIQYPICFSHFPKSMFMPTIWHTAFFWKMKDLEGNRKR